MTDTDAGRAVMQVLELVGESSDLGLGAEPALGDALAGVLRSVGARRGAAWGKEPTSGVLRRLAWRDAQGPAPSGGDRIGPAERPGLYAALLSGEEISSADDAGGDLAGLGLADGLLVPLRAGGETLGALGVAPAPEGAEHRQRIAVRAAARVFALALRNAQLFAGLQERARELDRQVRQLMALTEVARGVARSLDQAEVQRTIAYEARRLVRADTAVLLLEGKDGLAPVAASGAQVGGGPPTVEELAAWGPVTVVPIPAAEGGRAGVIALCRYHEEFRGDDIERLAGLADQAAAALANAALLVDLRRERDERRALAAAMVQSQEQERQRVAEDLHDGPVQELVGLSLMLDALARDLRRTAADAEEDTALSAERAAASARAAVRSLRQAILDLHPMALQELGLTAATRAVVQRLSWQGVEVDLDLEAADDLPPTRRTVAFRVLQEAIANAVRHAEPHRVAIAAHRADERVVIEVTDDGRGFDTATTQTRLSDGHLGLAAMHERAALAGGEVTITSLEGLGTTVRLVLPAGPDPAEPARG